MTQAQTGIDVHHHVTAHIIGKEVYQEWSNVVVIARLKLGMQG